jgi:hypothetical protein
VIFAVALSVIPNLDAQSQALQDSAKPTQVPSPVVVHGPVTVQGQVRLIKDEEPPMQGTLSPEIRSADASERSATADELSANMAVRSLEFAKLSFVISIFALLAAGAQVVIMWCQLRPALRELRTQSLFASINLVKQRLDSLTGGQWNLSHDSLYTPKAETPKQTATRVHNMANQLCDDTDDGDRREAVERLIRQWLQLEAELDKQMSIEK